MCRRTARSERDDNRKFVGEWCRGAALKEGSQITVELYVLWDLEKDIMVLEGWGSPEAAAETQQEQLQE